MGDLIGNGVNNKDKRLKDEKQVSLEKIMNCVLHLSDLRCQLVIQLELFSRETYSIEFQEVHMSYQL